MDAPFEIRPLDAAFGAEIIGFDPLRDATEEASAVWHAALGSHQLLVFRALPLDAEAQVALAATLGPPLVENDSGRAYQFVSNTHPEGILGDERFAFHSDHAFMPDPIDVISLYALEVPAAGTQTRFVNGVLAASALPDALRTALESREARHIINPAAESGAIPSRGPRLPDDLPHADHPALWRGARAGSEVLYINEQQTDLVRGLSEDANQSLLEALFAHLYSGRFLYTHEWHQGDLVVWDNRALQHARDPIPEGQHRNLRRVSVGGTAVHEFFRAHEKWGLDALG